MKIGEQFIFYNIPWHNHKTIVDALGEYNVHSTYSHGNLEFIRYSFAHERYKVVLRLIHHVLAESLGISYYCCGSMTMRRDDLEMALESDGSYYFNNVKKMRAKRDIDLLKDPPPDFALEVDIPKSSIDRLEIFAALGITEVWRFDGKRLQFLILNARREYIEKGNSYFLPRISPGFVLPFLKASFTKDDGHILRTAATKLKRLRK
ncbi:MAG: Uma2 family endonuclease [Gemmataceae bacterium]|nr:Uma2 family endonuclease [Gemmataceae bacterium]